MVVIATHNGGKMLLDLLDDIRTFKIPNNEVCIVDNLSTDITHLRELINLVQHGYKILNNPYGTYQVGAYLQAIHTYTSDVWFFLQDSIRLKQNIFEMVTPKLTDKNVYTLLTFPFDVYDNNDIRIDLKWHYNTSTYSRGIAFVTFFAKDSVVQLVKDEWFIPQNKFANTFTERALSVVFDRHNIEIIGLDVFDERANIGVGNTSGDGYPFFEKIYGGRQ